jgi:DNA-binding MltR family transcriptional regulator
MVRDHISFPNADDDFNEFLTEFQQESDRAAAMLASAYLDDLLRQLLLASFVDDSNVTTKLVKSQRPLGPFSARIAASYAFGLITDSERADLDDIRNIRNRFAHKLHGLTFAADAVAGRCRRFRCNAEIFEHIPELRADYSEDPRKLFDLATALLAHCLRRRVEQAVQREQARPPLWPVRR